MKRNTIIIAALLIVLVAGFIYGIYAAHDDGNSTSQFKPFNYSLTIMTKQ